MSLKGPWLVLLLMILGYTVPSLSTGVTPSITCYTRSTSTLTYFFGYFSNFGEPINFPTGSSNQLSINSQVLNIQATDFLPGQHLGVFKYVERESIGNSSVTWSLNGSRVDLGMQQADVLMWECPQDVALIYFVEIDVCSSLDQLELTIEQNVRDFNNILAQNAGSPNASQITTVVINLSTGIKNCTVSGVPDYTPATILLSYTTPNNSPINIFSFDLMHALKSDPNMALSNTTVKIMSGREILVRLNNYTPLMGREEPKNIKSTGPTGTVFDNLDGAGGLSLFWWIVIIVMGTLTLLIILLLCCFWNLRKKAMSVETL